MELIVKTDLQTLPVAIEYNHEELKAELSEQLKKYKNIIVTEDSIKEFKEDKANLNRLKTALENKRKEIKKQCLQPYENFERNIKELVVLIDEPIQLIDRQLKEIDEKRKEEKVKEIETLYHDNIGIFKELVPLDKIFNSRWLNATYKLENIALEIESIHTQLEEGLSIIEGIHTEFKQEIKDKFFETLDITKALSENTRLKEVREKQKALKEVELQKQKQVREFLTEKEQIKKQQQIEQNQEIKQQSQEAEQKGVQRLDFRVWVTPQQKRLLREFLLENHIKFGPVGKVE